MVGPKAVVAGVVGIDCIETPSGRARNVPGGPALYAGIASGLFAPTGIVSVVGRDFTHWNCFKGCDVSGIETRPGKTFRWEGRYSGSMNEAKTLRTDLNVSEKFHPEIPESYARAKFIFLANADPASQMEILKQFGKPAFTALDTMNYWISKKRRPLLRAISMVDCLLLNEGEARMLTKKESLISAAESLSAKGPEYVVIKKGEHGALLFCEREGHFFSPSYPISRLIDPTGAGDSFGGALTGFLASRGKVTEALLRKGVVYASSVASFTVSGFGADPLTKLTKAKVEARFNRFRKLVRF
ncbi:MAG: PfkB family carbohydrate kinase [archaeon]